MKILTWNQENLTITSNEHSFQLFSNEVFTNRTLTIESGVKAYIVEHYESTKKMDISTHFIIKEGATLEYFKVQDSNFELNVHYTFTLEENATLQMYNFEWGNATSQHTYQSNMHAQNSELYINGLVKLFGDALCENHFALSHEAAHSLTQIEYKHALHDESKALFQATTHVKNEAPYSQAYQNCQTLLLSDDATIFAQPHLEIDIDELQASHGATTGGLNKDELLYLQSRGIDEETAHAMLLKAFENKIFDKITHTEIKEYLENYKRSHHE